MVRSVCFALALILVSPHAIHAAWGEVDPDFATAGWLNPSWPGDFGPSPGALTTDSADRIVMAVNTGTSTVRFLRTSDTGTVDSSFGFLGSVSLTVPGASTARIVRLLPGVGNSLIAVGDAELTDGRWIVAFQLYEDGSLVDKFGIDGFAFTRGGVTGGEAFAADAALNGAMNDQLEVVGWIEHQALARDLGLRLIIDLGDGGTLAETTVSAVPSVGERWLRIADSGSGQPCHAILAERDGALLVFGYSGPASPSCGAPSFTLPLSLPGAPGAALRASGLVRASNGDFVVAAWVESGLLTKPTAYFRTVGATAALRSTWGNAGIAYVDAANTDWVGFQASRLLADGWTGDILSVGSELGTGGLTGTVHRVRAARLLSANGALDPSVPLSGAISPDSNRHHRVRDVAIVTSTGRPAAAVSTHMTDGFDVPKTWLVGLQNSNVLFGDGFETATTGAWSFTAP